VASPQEKVSTLSRTFQLDDAVVRRNARDIVADKIAASIASGLLQVGDALPSERDLAAALRVSRETVRGGMQILTARGIVEVSHGARTKVVSASVEPATADLHEPKRINNYDLESIHAARLLVERRVVSDAAVRIDNETLGLVDDFLAAQRNSLDDPVRFLIGDREFHLAIYRSCGNAALADFVSDLYTYMLDFRRKAVSRPGAIAESIGDHEKIVAGLHARDSRAVVAAFEIHLERIYATTNSVLASRGKQASRAVAKGGARSTRTHS
jgi:DNA-binding FadR family transcriptional regulator